MVEGGPKPHLGARSLLVGAACAMVIAGAGGSSISRAIDGPEPTPPGIGASAKPNQEATKAPDAQQQKPPAIDSLKTIVNCTKTRQQNRWECPKMQDGNGTFGATVTKKQDGSFEFAAKGKTASLPEAVGSSATIEVFDKFRHKCYAVATIPQKTKDLQVAVGCTWKTERD